MSRTRPGACSGSTSGRGAGGPGAAGIGAGIGAGIALYFGGTFLQLLLPGIVKWLPFNAANAVVANTSSERMAMMGMSIDQLEPTPALVVVALWLVGSLVVTAIYVERAEISH